MKFPPTIFMRFTGALLFTLPGSLLSQESLPPEKLEFFENHIRPALIKYCYECHSEESGKTRGGLLLDTREGILQGGDSGDVLDSENWADSYLLAVINWEEPDYEMPPKQQMPTEVIAHFKQWLEMGAPDPRLREKLVVKSEVDIEAGKQHWAFQQPVRPATDSIDGFISEKLTEAGLNPATEADALTLLRRLNFDLVGLPPTPGEAQAFHAAWQKDAAAAIEAKVDELLERPQFGERWGRHWLDVARYAESSGEPNFTFPHAWRYRDYVIDAFNADKPYDQFIREQIAGDLLPAADENDRQENLIATGFLAVGVKSLNDRNPRTFQMNLVDEQIDTMSKAILGVTAACARCHDHKFDPIPTTDYYALAGIFMSTDTRYGTVSGLQNHRPTELIVLPKKADAKLSPSYTQEEIDRMREEIEEVNSRMQQIRLAGRLLGERPEQRQMVGMRNRVSLLEGALGTLNPDGTTKTFAMGAQEAADIVNANVLVRGDVEKKAQEVPRGFLQVLENDVKTDSIEPGVSGRLELAHWLTSKENPLTARVMANRIWMHLFGEPLVASPNNWGLTGQKPSHPELLDHLAIRLMDNGWSMKSLIREIVLTDAYRRSSAFDESNYAADPDNRLLWRANPRQLPAESVRDSILAMSGNLDLERPLGSPVMTVGDARVGRQIDAVTFDNSVHRSVYLPVVRNEMVPSLTLFDFADPNAPVAQRDETNVPAQALYLMNHPFLTAESRAMAEQLWKRFGSTEERVKGAFLLTFGRPATEEDLTASREFFAEFKVTPPPADPAPANATRRFRGPGTAGGAPGAGGMRGKGKGMGKGKGKGKGVGPVGETPPAAEPSKPLPPEQETLAMFCQALMTSAEFRILN